MDMDITDKIVLITGAGRGLGRSLARGLAARGARVAVLARRRDQAEEVADDLDQMTGVRTALPVVADVAKEEDVRAAVARIDQEYGRLDAVISNAAWMPPRRHLVEVEASTLERVFRSNVFAGFWLTKHAAPLMSRGGGGRFVYITSSIGEHANPGLGPYGASKAAVNILMNVAHQELSAQGIRTVALAPGLTDTPGMRASVGDEYVDRIAQAYPGGRLGQPEDIVPLTAFLCSPDADHLSGTVISVRPPALG